jgi:hypothetical protein
MLKADTDIPPTTLAAMSADGELWSPSRINIGTTPTFPM